MIPPKKIPQFLYTRPSKNDSHFTQCQFCYFQLYLAGHFPKVSNVFLLYFDYWIAKCGQTSLSVTTVLYIVARCYIFSLQNRTTILDDRKYIFVGKRWTLLLNVFMILLLPILTFTFHLPCRRFFALFVLRRCQEEYYTRRQYHQSSTEQREH